MPTILCIASFFKGNEFIRECKRRGAGVVLLTREKLLGAEWARDSLDDLIAIPGKTSVQSYLAAATYVARQRRVVRVVALEEYDVVTAAHIREHLCLPGMGTTTARSFQDKLAMRCRASEVAIHQPQFVPLVNYDVVDEFMKQTSPPWMLKPRIGASSMGIKKLYDPEAVWRALADLDAREAVHERSDFHLLEQFIPGHVYHVDSLVAAGKVLFASVERYGAPPFDVSHCGGVPLSYFVKYGSREQRALLALNKKLLKGFGFEQGVTHAEFIRPAASTQYPNEPFIFLRLQHESAAPIQLTLSRRRRVSIFGANGPVLNSPRPSVRTFCHLCALSMAALRYHWHVRRTLPLVAMTIPRSFIV